GGEDFLGTHHTHPITYLHAGRQLVLVVLLGTGLALDLIEQILEGDPVALEADGVNVGQVVGNGGHFQILCRQTCLGDPKCCLHVLLLSDQGSVCLCRGRPVCLPSVFGC